MKRKLLLQGVSKYIAGLLMVGLLLFVPAGTLNYGGAWLFIALLFIPILLMGIILLLKAPELLKKRLSGKEKESDQKFVTRFSGAMFLAGFILAGVDFRLGWTNVPNGIVILAAVLLIFGYAMYAEVMRENAYLSRTVEVQEGQKVIDTGLYGIVRHPMYMATVLLFLSIPLVLGSWIAFAVFLVYPILLVVRIRNEEKVLEAGLEGYTEYMQRVKYRMIPFIW